MGFILRYVKDFFKTASHVVILAMFLIAAALFLLRICRRGEEKLPTFPEKEFLTETEIYTRPVIRIPFTKPKLPIDPAISPVHPSRIDKTVVIESGPEESRQTVSLVIDKKGRVYKTKDTSDDVEIVTTQWRQPVFEIKPRFGYSLVWAGDLFNCVSLDLVRIWRIHAGVEIGVQAVFKDYLIGVSGKFRVTDNMKVLAGRDFYGSRFYAGVQFSF